jgi:O-acetyl-ADP-ribose deacetylase (regulator of RNase III)
MITYVYGDLFQSPAKVLVNAVNTVGVMGKGIALDFKRIYPEMFQQYQQLCEKKQFTTGQLWIYKTPHKWILNFPTKKHWRDKSKLEYIEEGLVKFVATYDERRIDSVSFPRLGCGNGELDWEREVQPLMEKYLSSLPIPVYVHIFDPAEKQLPEHQNFEQIKAWLRSQPRDLPFSEVWVDLCQHIGAGMTLQSDDGHPFLASFCTDDEEYSLSIVDPRCDTPTLIDYDSLVDLWQQLRAAGYLMEQTFPSGLDKYAKYLIPILSSLDYVQSIRLYRTLPKVRVPKPQTALQFIPPVSDPSHLKIPVKIG